MPTETQTLQWEGFDRDGEINFDALVNSVSDRFESDTAVKITQKARLALIEPALPHKRHVMQELQMRTITINFLRDSIQKVLENALDIVRITGQRTIDEKDIAASMKRYCPYLFWC